MPGEEEAYLPYMALDWDTSRTTFPQVFLLFPVVIREDSAAV